MAVIHSKISSCINSLFARRWFLAFILLVNPLVGFGYCISFALELSPAPINSIISLKAVLLLVFAVGLATTALYPATIDFNSVNAANVWVICLALISDSSED